MKKNHFFCKKSVRSLRVKQGSLQFWTRSKTNSQDRPLKDLHLSYEYYDTTLSTVQKPMINQWIISFSFFILFTYFSLLIRYTTAYIKGT